MLRQILEQNYSVGALKDQSQDMILEIKISPYKVEWGGWWEGSGRSWGKLQNILYKKLENE